MQQYASWDAGFSPENLFGEDFSLVRAPPTYSQRGSNGVFFAGYVCFLLCRNLTNSNKCLPFPTHTLMKLPALFFCFCS